MAKSIGRLAMALTGLMLGAACTAIRTKTPEGETVTMTESQFASYVEHVFRHHNEVYNELISDLSMDDENEADHFSPALLDAEAAMLDACLPVNEIVSAMSEGRSPGFTTKLQLPRAVPDCEVATRKVEKLIPEGFSVILSH